METRATPEEADVTGLPRRYELALWLVGSLVGIAAGARIALSTAVPLVWHSGALIGAVVGPLLVGVYGRSLSRNLSAPTRPSRG